MVAQLRYRGLAYAFRPIQATGGEIFDYQILGTEDAYRYHVFTATSTFLVNQISDRFNFNDVEYLVVAGGGAGGAADNEQEAGGGGANGLTNGVGGTGGGGNGGVSGTAGTNGRGGGGGGGITSTGNGGGNGGSGVVIVRWRL